MRINSLDKIMSKKNRGLTLIELLVSLLLISLVIIGISSFELFSRNQVLNSDRRARVQNEISYAIERMSKDVQQSIGDFNNPPIRRFPAAGAQTGFQIRRDLNPVQTPGDLADDTWISFDLAGNSLRVIQGASIEVLAARIVAGCVNNVMPESPVNGFYVNITDQGTVVEIGLAGRFIPAAAVSPDNPQISMKTRLISPSSSAR